jgi:hypothetical protein
MNNVLIILLLLFGCLAALFFIPTLMTKRAMRQVIRILKRTGTMDPENAKSIIDLRLNPPSFKERIMKTRDYKPKALEFLISLHIVLYSEDGKIYLSEKNLLSSKLVERWPSLAKDIRPQ